MTSPIDNGFARIDKESIKRQYGVPGALTGQDIAYDGTSTINEKIDSKVETSTIQETIEDTIGSKLKGSGVVNVNYNDSTGETTISAVGLGTGDMQGANNLSELTDESIARTNLGLGTLATQDGNFSDKANDSAVVHKTGNEQIYGVKTFYSSPIVPTPVSGTQASNKDYADSTPDFYQYSIVRTVDGSGNLTVSLKNYEGNDPTPTKPVKIMIGGVVRTITSALIQTMNAGTNYLNLGSAELATKEVDLFIYLVWDSVNLVVKLFYARIPNGTKIGDFVFTLTDEKGVNGNFLNGTSTDQVVNIGRFNATLSAGPGYTWSILATSVIINRPIYETRTLDYNSIISASGSMTISSSVAIINKYRIIGNTLEFYVSNTFTTGGTASNDVIASLPFNSGLDSLFSGIPCYDTVDFISSGIINGSSIKVRRPNITWTLGTGRVFGAQGFYCI